MLLASSGGRALLHAFLEIRVAGTRVTWWCRLLRNLSPTYAHQWHLLPRPSVFLENTHFIGLSLPEARWISNTVESGCKVKKQVVFSKKHSFLKNVVLQIMSQPCCSDVLENYTHCLKNVAKNSESQADFLPTWNRNCRICRRLQEKQACMRPLASAFWRRINGQFS